MEVHNVERRLAAILAADVVGYSRLMEVVAREFGVDYIAEGSVQARGSGNDYRRLINGETETHIWAERYDRKLEDIFAIQDEVTASIASTLFGRVEAAATRSR